MSTAGIIFTLIVWISGALLDQVVYTLRDYQQKAVDSVVKYLKKKRTPAVVVLPTGARKSLVIAELARTTVFSEEL